MKAYNYKIKADFIYLIGIDSGTNTGFCLYDRFGKMIRKLKTMQIHRAMMEVKAIYDVAPGKVMVVVEDARQVNMKTDPVKAQGAGSVKRDANIWEEFLSDKEIFPDISFQFVRPNKNNTKNGLSAESWRKITKWAGPADTHARDAAMLVFGY